MTEITNVTGCVTFKICVLLEGVSKPVMLFLCYRCLQMKSCA